MVRSYLTGRTQVFTTHSGHTLPVPLISGVPQGSSLGPGQFISYTECTVPPLPFPHTQSNITCSLHDDTQSYSYCQISETPLLVARLSSCIDYLAKSHASLRLQHNPSKTEFISFGSRTNLLKTPSSSRSLVRKACLLSGRPRHMEQSPRHHPYHRLPPGLPSCAKDISVPLSI